MQYQHRIKMTPVSVVCRSHQNCCDAGRSRGRRFLLFHLLSVLSVTLNTVARTLLDMDSEPCSFATAAIVPPRPALTHRSSFFECFARPCIPFLAIPKKALSGSARGRWKTAAILQASSGPPQCEGTDNKRKHHSNRGRSSGADLKRDRSSTSTKLVREDLLLGTSNKNHNKESVSSSTGTVMSNCGDKIGGAPAHIGKGEKNHEGAKASINCVLKTNAGKQLHKILADAGYYNFERRQGERQDQRKVSSTGHRFPATPKAKGTVLHRLKEQGGDSMETTPSDSSTSSGSRQDETKIGDGDCTSQPHLPSENTFENEIGITHIEPEKLLFFKNEEDQTQAHLIEDVSLSEPSRTVISTPSSSCTMKDADAHAAERSFNETAVILQFQGNKEVPTQQDLVANSSTIKPDEHDQSQCALPRSPTPTPIGIGNSQSTAFALASCSSENLNYTPVPITSNTQGAASLPTPELPVHPGFTSKPSNVRRRGEVARTGSSSTTLQGNNRTSKAAATSPVVACRFLLPPLQRRHSADIQEYQIRFSENSNFIRQVDSTTLVRMPSSPLPENSAIHAFPVSSRNNYRVRTWPSSPSCSSPRFTRRQVQSWPPSSAREPEPRPVHVVPLHQPASMAMPKNIIKRSYQLYQDVGSPRRNIKILEAENTDNIKSYSNYQHQSKNCNLMKVNATSRLPATSSTTTKTTNSDIVRTMTSSSRSTVHELVHMFDAITLQNSSTPQQTTRGLVRRTVAGYRAQPVQYTTPRPGIILAGSP
ncbi:unnamed protein product [Amoebophrya sp. A25]|nr:unnamed protein product [Amoebophrya sp. A25]|eukprot:GSA25T00007754001.1